MIRYSDPRRPQPLQVPRYNREVLTDKQTRMLFYAIINCLRNLSARQTEQSIVLFNTGVAPVEATFERTAGIFPSALVHINPDGLATLATRTDATKYATHVVASMGAGKLICYGMGTWPVRCEPYSTNFDNYLFLSDLPGYAKDTAPSIGSGEIRQLIGYKVGLRSDESALGLMECKFDEFTYA